MFLFGKNESDRIYIGGKHVLRIYKGLVLWYKYRREIAVKAISKLFSGAKSTLEMAIAGALSAIGKISSGASAKIETDVFEHPKAAGGVSSIADVKGGTGHTEKIKVDEISFTAADVTLTDHNGNIQAEEQHIVSRDIAHAETGKAQPQETENHILFTQNTPTANKGQAMSKPVEQDMQFHITDTVTGGAGYAKAQKAETKGFFSYIKPKMLAQKIMPEMQEVKAFFKDIVSFGSGHAKPQEATENNIFFTAEKADASFGYVLPTPTAQEMHVADNVSGGVGHAKPQSATAESYFENLAQLTDETTDVTAETTAHSSSIALFDKGYGEGIKADDGGISGSNSVVYKPEKVFEIDNAGGISGADSTVYKPDKLFKTDMLIQSGAFARLFRVVQLSAVTTAKLITQPPLFRYVFLGAEGGGVFSGGGILDIATPDEFNRWHYQQGNTLYIFTASTAEQTDSEIAIDTGSVNVWHEQKDNVLYIYVANTAQQSQAQLEIDTAITEEMWAMQVDNTLYINRAIGTLQEETDVEIDIIENLKWAEQNGNVLTINQLLTDEEIEVV